VSGLSENPRRLLVFAPLPGDASATRQRELLSGAEAGISDRDLRVEYLTGEEAEESRREYGVTAEEFAALLIGRDGGVKHRYGEPAAPEELFGHIDEMPMRRRELRERDDAGSGGHEGS